jgi:putative transposase
MPRIARRVFPGVPHHIVQRGNRREDVFFGDADRSTYLDWLGQHSAERGVHILAYCLMTNHVHIVAVPTNGDDLEKVFRPLHTRYAMRINRGRGWNGHVWQGRFFSSALDESYMWTAIRYVELNPVRARMVERAEDYRWSSAAAHCGLRTDALITADPVWRSQLDSIDNWSAWLKESDPPDRLKDLRELSRRSLPCGSKDFVFALGHGSGQSLVARPQGRPRKRF